MVNEKNVIEINVNSLVIGIRPHAALYAEVMSISAAVPPYAVICLKPDDCFMLAFLEGGDILIRYPQPDGIEPSLIINLRAPPAIKPVGLDGEKLTWESVIFSK